MTAMDFNALEQAATNAIRKQRFRDAIRIYLFMSDGDPSLDAGHLAERLGHCYEAIDDIPAARYWFGRAIEENPDARPESSAARERLGPEDVDDLLRLG